MVAGVGYGALGQPRSLENTALEAYAALGITIYATQTAGGLIQLVQKPGTQLTGLKAGVVDLTTSVEFNALMAINFSIAALVGFLAAYNDLSNSPDDLDYANAGFDTAQGTGYLVRGASRFGVPQIAKSVFESQNQALLSRLQTAFNMPEYDAGAEWLAGLGYTSESATASAAADAVALAETVGLVGSILTVVAAIGVAVVLGIKGYQETQAFQHDSSEFLQRGYGLNSDTADIISSYMVQNDTSLPTELQDYAKAYNMTVPQLLQKLNQEPAYKVRDFINTAFNLTKGITPPGQPIPQTEAARLQILTEKAKADSMFSKN
jgi:hypothetical protein